MIDFTLVTNVRNSRVCAQAPAKGVCLENTRQGPIEHTHKVATCDQRVCCVSASIPGVPTASGYEERSRDHSLIILVFAVINRRKIFTVSCL